MRPLFAIAVLLASAHSGAADPVDRLFSAPHLEMLTAERSLSYRHARTAAIGGAPVNSEEVIRLERGADGAHVVVTMDAEGAAPRPGAFRGMTGNPILTIFLESVVRTVGEATGGSPFYLRNRIKEAMRDRMAEESVTAQLGGRQVPAHRIELRPFEGDRHAEELGPFTGLELSFVLADAAPGKFLSLEASAGEGRSAYSEEIRLDEAR